MPGAAFGACEEGIFPVERYGTDRALDGIAVDLDAAVVDEAGKAFRA
jgi:hypothetical protein